MSRGTQPGFNYLSRGLTSHNYVQEVTNAFNHLSRGPTGPLIMSRGSQPGFNYLSKPLIMSWGYIHGKAGPTGGVRLLTGIA